ncbi:hypothetical protein M9Y10_022037 [Tritrichomonas musculus]|uniref:Uncharacterized protein n=1 Tax=Tritrichomonas musculus TaxID=1915356 RepID=A0ABR2KT54_9EUKA
MDIDTINSFSTKFESQEIKDADEFEKNAIQFRNLFVQLKYDTIQPNFDKFFKISIAIASHYRPIVQTNGCDCLYVLCDQAAPAQIKRISPQLRQSFDQLIQVGHAEVLPALLPVIERSVSIVYDENPSSKVFHDFFMHYLETWSRESTTAVASFTFSKNFSHLMPFLGLTASRYVKPTFAVISKRMSLTKSKSHVLEFLKDILALCEQIWPVVKTCDSEIKSIIEMSREIIKDDKDVNEICSKIEQILSDAPNTPQF